MRLIALLAALLFSSPAYSQYTFPEGVPVDSKAVTWYRATQHYQIVNTVGAGVHHMSYNISAAKPIEKFGNANLEFPWKSGGIDESSNAAGFKFHQFPVAGKITYWNERGIYRWSYPEGMLFGEVLTVDIKGSI